MITLFAKAPYTQLARENGLNTWEDLSRYVQNLAYARTSNPKDLSLVFKEGRGTCSGKHAILACIAEENSIPAKLMVAIFKMSVQSTPKIKDILEHYHLDYIPEAHCYLLVNGIVQDNTSKDPLFSDFDRQIIETHEINPHKVSEEKTKLHKDFIKCWLKEQALPFSFEELWKIRESCIESLS